MERITINGHEITGMLVEPIDPFALEYAVVPMRLLNGDYALKGRRGRTWCVVKNGTPSADFITDQLNTGAEPATFTMTLS